MWEWMLVIVAQIATPTSTNLKPNQTKPNQTKPNQTKPNQTKPNQTKPNPIPSQTQTKPKQKSKWPSTLPRTKAYESGGEWMVECGDKGGEVREREEAMGSPAGLQTLNTNTNNNTSTHQHQHHKYCCVGVDVLVL